MNDQHLDKKLSSVSELKPDVVVGTPFNNTRSSYSLKVEPTTSSTDENVCIKPNKTADHHRINTNFGFLKKNGKNWDKIMALNLRDYAYNAYKSSWMYGEDAQDNFELNRKLTFTANVISLVATVIIASVLPILDKENMIMLSYFFIVVGILLNVVGGILGAYKFVYDFDTIVANNSEQSAKYDKMYRNIKDQFYLQKENRYDAKTFLEFIADRFDELNRESSFISRNTQKKWDDNAPRNTNGDIDLDQILLLPNELRSDEDNPESEFVTIDLGPYGNNNNSNNRSVHQDLKKLKSRR